MSVKNFRMYSEEVLQNISNFGRMYPVIDPNITFH